MLGSPERNIAEIDGLSAGFAHLDATEPPPALSQVRRQNDLASALETLCNASPVNNPEVQGLEKCWSSIRTARDGMQILWEHFVNVSKDLNLPVVHDIRNSYRDGKGLRREGVFAFRNWLTGQAPHGLGQIFAFFCLSYVTSCLLHCRNRLDKGDILAGINLSFCFFQIEDERRAFIRLAERLWPEALGHLHVTVLALNDNSQKLWAALRRDERPYSLPSTTTYLVSPDTIVPELQASIAINSDLVLCLILGLVHGIVLFRVPPSLLLVRLEALVDYNPSECSIGLPGVARFEFFGDP
ncbi:uncharacterized protein FFFS_15898 [Fusarium fujikuroi]|nr:uncharacterized protein FFFS_15898 [Fusarium fujikuroi]